MTDFTHYRVLQDHQIPVRSEGTTALSNDYIGDLTKNMKINIIKLEGDELDFDVSGIDASIANALRRILVAEVPTIAIEHVWIAVNSSIIQDEVLAHRVGLIPIKIDPNKLEYVDDEETDKDTIVFHFDVECKNQYSGEIKPNGEKKYVNENALSSSLTWQPQGNQAEVFPDGVAPVHEDIVVAKLKPGQRIEFEAHCRKGVGKDHQKFSPVATASYRLLPDISFSEPVVEERAQELQSMCPMGVFDIEDIGGVTTAVVARPRDCTMCRECIRLDSWQDTVKLKRKADHFIFSIESAGGIPPETIFREAIGILKEKSLKFQALVDEYESEL